MNITVNDNFRITTDPRNFILEQRGVHGEDSKTPGKVKWKQIGFYTSIETALDGWQRRVLLDSELTTIEELKTLLRELSDSVKRLISGEAN